MNGNSPYYSLAWRPLISLYNDRYEQPQTPLTIALLGGLYLAILMYGYEVPQTSLTVSLVGGLYLAIINDLY
jgi:hypothetical protein